MNTYKLVLFNPAYIKSETLRSSLKGFPVGFVIADIPKPFIKVINTGIKIIKK